MNKEEKKVVEEYYRDYNIDPRTISMIVHHYIDVGERTIKGLTQKDIDDIYQRELIKEKECEKKGTILLITPDFTAYLLTACRGLSLLPDPIRYKFIKENLV